MHQARKHDALSDGSGTRTRTRRRTRTRTRTRARARAGAVNRLTMKDNPEPVHKAELLQTLKNKVAASNLQNWPAKDKTREGRTNSQSRTMLAVKEKGGRRPPSQVTRQEQNGKRSQSQFRKQRIKKLGVGTINEKMNKNV